MITPDIVRLSPNFNDAPPRGAVVIIHATRSGVPHNPTEFEGTLNYMMTPGTVSSQWVIACDGRKARVVPDNKQAWHAAADNAIARGIELEQGAESDGFTVPQIDSLVVVCRGYVAMGVPPRHAAGTHESGFVGHEETAQGRAAGKSDPGRGFDWPAFLAAIQEQEEEVMLDLLQTPTSISAMIGPFRSLLSPDHLKALLEAKVPHRILFISEEELEKIPRWEDQVTVSGGTELAEAQMTAVVKAVVERIKMTVP